jgi:hypothetical protein
VAFYVHYHYLCNTLKYLCRFDSEKGGAVRMKFLTAFLNRFKSPRNLATNGALEKEMLETLTGKQEGAVAAQARKQSGGKKRLKTLGVLFFALFFVAAMGAAAFFFLGPDMTSLSFELAGGGRRASNVKNVKKGEAFLPLSKENKALFDAVRAGNAEATRRAMEAGASFDTPNSLGVTPMKAAIALNQVNIVHALIEGGGKSKLFTDEGNSALIYSIVQNKPEITRLLLKYAADVNKIDKNGFSPMMYAIDRDFVDIVRELLDAGADANQRDKNGYTPLMRAVNMGRADVVAALLKAGASADTRSPSGESAIDIARRRNKPIIIALLARIS